MKKSALVLIVISLLVAGVSVLILSLVFPWAYHGKLVCATKKVSSCGYAPDYDLPVSGFNYVMMALLGLPFLAFFCIINVYKESIKCTGCFGCCGLIIIIIPIFVTFMGSEVMAIGFFIYIIGMGILVAAFGLSFYEFTD